MRHFYSDFIFCKDNFFQNPSRITNLANSLEYTFKDKTFPGERTENIANIDTPECVEFSNFFIKKLVNEVYTNITSMNIDIRFHRYPLHESSKLNPLNHGWVHTDHESLAGVLYLNTVCDFEAGTSMYSKNIDAVVEPNSIREDLNLSKPVDINKYKHELDTYNSQFTETVRIGNSYNRLITYDSKIYHKPNNFYIGNNEHRTTLLFVISDYTCKPRQYNIYE